MTNRATMLEALDLLRRGVELLAQLQSESAAPDDSPLLDSEELAAALRVPVTWVETAAREGRIPFYRIGRYVRFRRTEVEAELRVAQRVAHR